MVCIVSEIRAKLEKAASGLATAAIICETKPEKALELLGVVSATIGGTLVSLGQSVAKLNTKSLEKRIGQLVEDVGHLEEAQEADREYVKRAEERAREIQHLLDRDFISDNEDYLKTKEMVRRFADLHPDLQLALRGEKGGKEKASGDQ